MSTNDGGHAFPVKADSEWYAGMTLRDWFAGQALSGYLADSVGIIPHEDAAEHAYRYADAMIAARDA